MQNQSLVITAEEIKIQHAGNEYRLSGFPSLGFPFSYLYYEPVSNNFKKVLEDDQHQLFYANLTDNDILLIQEQLTKFNDAEYLTAFLAQYEFRPELFAAPGAAENAPPRQPVHCVDATNSYVGMQILPQTGLREVTKAPPKDLYLESFGISYRWNDDTADWVVNGNYADQRRLEYLKQIPISNQLGALFGAVQALANNQSLPVDFVEIMEKIQQVKTSIPKE